MKTNRRGFLGRIAALAAVAPLVAVAAAEPAQAAERALHIVAREDAVLHPFTATSGDLTFVTTGNLTVSGDTLTFRDDQTLTYIPDKLAAWDSDGTLVYLKDGLTRDAIEQARADGYNRGREVESAAWEARGEFRGWVVNEYGGLDEA